ncbi:hypothetical protein FPQ14_03100 [Gilliamella apicola]|uniref:PTS EIIA type-4 domain-containing protein n=2 Tax=Gilliamella TaxID=1193503 RepID=A0A556RTL3_9GAMM|nr:MULTISPECIES: hypothetical protein [Gilliamella]MBI0005962.1 hypothetical protein [Gilliamella sp. W8126]MBI0036917.1 hypothetical protein [Gilliamella sp. B14384G10]MBI0039429.1 hypothetical protein [Gilliamella sp. B14384G7]MBI0050912.1 hypothetical protein [Gilliamella sp. B14384G13]MBI0053204.1 hypothetical protein [Gilliamella sp. B14384H2]
MKIVVTSHGELCEGILSSYQMIAGDISQFISVKLDDKGISDFSSRLTTVLDEQTMKNEVVIVLSDIMGGTPYNETFRYMLANPNKVYLMAGLNLSMLIQAATIINEPNIDEAINSILEAGQASISIAPITENSSEDLDF